MGASTNANRYSNAAIRELTKNHHPVVAFGKRNGKVLNVQIETELIPYKDIDTVTLYLNPYNQVQFYDYIISLAPRRVIFNPGTENPEFFKILRENNIHPEIACTLVLLSLSSY